MFTIADRFANGYLFLTIMTTATLLKLTFWRLGASAAYRAQRSPLAMSDKFASSFRPILILSKMFGIYDVSLALESGKLRKNLSHVDYRILELVQICVLFYFNFAYACRKGINYQVLLRTLFLTKFWLTIYAGRFWFFNNYLHDHCYKYFQSMIENKILS